MQPQPARSSLTRAYALLALALPFYRRRAQRPPLDQRVQALTLLGGFPLTGFPPPTWLALLALGLVTHVGGWLSINDALGLIPASIVSVTLLAQPALTAILTIPLLGQGSHKARLQMQQMVQL